MIVRTATPADAPPALVEMIDRAFAGTGLKRPAHLVVMRKELSS